MLGGLYTNFFHHHYGLPVVKTRFFNSYGPGEGPGQYRNVIPNFIYWAMLGHPLPFTGSGGETRDFTYVTDIVDALLRAGYYDKAVGSEMNIASGVETNILEMANKINEIVGNGAIHPKGTPKVDTRSGSSASIERQNDIIGYSPQMDFDEGLTNTIDWFKHNWTAIRRDAEFPPRSSFRRARCGREIQTSARVNLRFFNAYEILQHRSFQVIPSLSARCHDVEIVLSRAKYRESDLGRILSQYEGVKVTELSTTTLRHGSSLGRVLVYLSYWCQAMAMSIMGGRVDVNVFLTQPPF